MILYILLCHVLFVPFINTSNSTVSQPEIINKTVSEPEPRKINQSNETKVTLLSEGGSLLPGAVLALAKDKLTSLDTELGKNKVKPVVARKGVVYTEDDNLKLQKSNVTSINQNPSVAPILQDETDALKKNNFMVNTNKTMETKVSSTLPTKLSSDVKVINKTEIPKKPLLLSYDTLVNMTVKSSPGTLVSDQIQSPNKNLKAYAKNANSHPGMIMPLVITILLVPMFAVLGYMALRRGQEAWKNRHYKRMDFLLDGMYND